MYTITLTVRQVDSDLLVVAETSEPGLTSGIRVEEALDLDRANLPDEFALTTADRRQYGQHLGKAVFHGEILTAFQRVQARADTDKPPLLHVLLSIEVETLRSVRWERLCAPLDGGWKFLRLQQRTPFSIYLPSQIDKRYPTISRVELKALVVVANLGPGDPYGLAEFKAGPVVESIRQALGEIPCTVLASDAGEQLPGADGLPTLEELCRWLTFQRFPILHIVSHGKYFKGNEKEPAETILFLRKSGPIDPAKPNDHVERVPATELIERLGELQGAKTLPHLTFLCSCETASPKAEQGLGGLGQRLVRELGMPAVVAMTEPVSLALTQQLASEFYQRLRKHGSVDLALDESCAGIADRGDVLIPTLFSRLGGRKLFDEFGPLTTGEWENGLKRLEPLITERAPKLLLSHEVLASRARAALDIRKRTENRPATDTEAAWARGELQNNLQPDLNELCEDFLEGPFDELARDLPLRVPKYDARCPFPGLGVFDVTKNEKGEVEDFRPFFFGRRQLTEKVCGLLREHRFLAVLGGSGTGKSSLIRAGVIEQLRKKKPDLQVVLFPPGKDPLGRLQQERVRTPAPDILVVDQFEELFTLCTDANAREAFLAELLPLRDKCPVVITMRTDFLGECAEHDELHALLNSNSKHLELLQPLRGDELREVVEQQRNAVGLQFEPELAKRIFEDLEHEPGAMPLLQHCLRQLWNYRRGRKLCFADYLSKERVGGVEGAISRTADDVYMKLSPGEKELCPFIFERLVRIDTEATDLEVRRDTRQREELSQLTPEGGDANLTKTIVTRLADAKLLITTQNPQTKETEVEVAHEALIRHWDKLQGWINSARVTARLVERVRTDAGHYYGFQANPDNLTLRGVVLIETETLLNSKPPRLTEDEATFVRLCRMKENEDKDRELRNAEERERLAIARAEDARNAADKQRRLTRWAVGAAAIALVFLIVAIIFQQRSAWNETQATTLANDKVELAEKEKTQRIAAQDATILATVATKKATFEAENARYQLLVNLFQHGRTHLDAGKVEQARERFASADKVKGSDPFGSLLVNLGWWEYYSKSPPPLRSVDANVLGPSSVAIHPNGRWATAGGGLPINIDFHLFDLIDSKVLRTYKGHKGRVNTCAISSDGTLILTGGEDRKLLLWDIDHSSPLRTLGEMKEAVIAVAIAPKGDFAVTGDKLGGIAVWDMNTGKLRASVERDDRLLEMYKKELHSIVLSPDTKTIVAGHSDGSFSLRGVGTPEKARFIQAHASSIHGVSFSVDGTRLATAGEDGTVKVWDPDSERLISDLRGHVGKVYAVIYLPDGRLASGGDDGARLWDVKQGRIDTIFRGGQGPVVALRSDPRGQFIFSARKRDPEEWKLSDTVGRIFQEAELHKLQSLLITLGDPEEWLKTLRNDQELLERLKKQPESANEASLLATKIDGVLKQFGGEAGMKTAARNLDSMRQKRNGMLDVWGLQNQEFRSLKSGIRVTKAVALSGNGQLAFLSDYDTNAVYVFDTSARVKLGTLVGHRDNITALAMFPSGPQLASGSNDGSVRIWNLLDLKATTILRGAEKPITSISISQSGRQLAAGYSDGSIDVWQIADGKRVWSAVWNKTSVNKVGFLDESRLLAAGSNGQLSLWQIGHDALPAEFEGHRKPVTTLAVGQSGRIAVSGSSDGSIIVWEFPAGHIRHRLRPLQRIVRDMVLSHDERSMLVAGLAGEGAGVILWDLERGQPLGEYPTQGTDFEKLALAGDGSLMFTEEFRSEGAKHFVWDLSTYKRYASFQREFETKFPQGNIEKSLAQKSKEILAQWFMFRGYSSIAKDLLLKPDDSLNAGTASVGLAQAFWSTGDLKRARAEFLRIDLGQDSSQAEYVSIVNRFFAVQESLADLSWKLARQPGDRGVIKQRGDLYYSVGNFKQAGDDYSRLIELDPSGEGPYVSRAYCYEAMRQYGEALADFQAAKKKKNGSAAPLGRSYWYAFFKIGASHLNNNQYDLAVGDLSESLARFADHPDTWATRGLCYLRLSKANTVASDARMSLLEKALHDLQMVIKLNPQEGGVNEDGSVWTRRGARLIVAEAHYNSACALALHVNLHSTSPEGLKKRAADIDKAFIHLTESVQNGLVKVLGNSPRAVVEQDGDLDSLRSDARFKEFMSKIPK